MTKKTEIQGKFLISNISNCGHTDFNQKRFKVAAKFLRNWFDDIFKETHCSVGEIQY